MRKDPSGADGERLVGRLGEFVQAHDDPDISLAASAELPVTNIRSP